MRVNCTSPSLYPYRLKILDENGTIKEDNNVRVIY